MLSPSYLAGLPDEMVKIYSQLEADIACDVARRVAKLSKVTDSSKWQMVILDELGSLKSSINKALTKYNDQAQKELKRLFEEAVQKSAQKDLAQYNKAHLSDNQKQILEATVMKLSDGKIAKGAATTDIINNQFKADYEGFVRLTQTIASNAESRFVEECNFAYMKVASGAFDYDTAIKQSVNSLAKNDRTSVNYNYKKETRSLSIEAAVRMNVMTGINQTCAEITERNCEDLGVELVEVDAHEGARPEHAAWQGKVYVRGKAREVDGVFYDSFEEVCKPGTATGICGINCRHSYYPYFPGMEKHYDGKDLKEMNKKDVEYNGKKMTKYEARQKQRAIERKIRQWKRTADIQKAGGVDDTSARVKLGEWQKIAQDFTDKTGLRRDYEREYIGTKSGKQPRGITTTIQGFEDNLKKANEIKRLDNARNKIVATVKQGKPMNFTQADGGAPNPNFKKGGGYEKNCQSCVVAYEMRRRGFNVEAMPNYKGSMSEVLSYKTNLAWIDRTTGKNPEYLWPTGKTLQEQIKWLEENLKPNNRYTLEWTWKGGKYGHIIHCYKNIKNQVSFYDPQKGINNRQTEEIKSYFEKAIIKTFKLLDIQNCDINLNVVNKIVKARG